jgi:PAS domain S-box-containing protein
VKPDSFAARLALVILAYFLTGWLGLRFATYHGSVTLIWAPTGIALATFLAWGLRLWPGVWLGALLVNLVVSAQPPPIALAVACGNTGGPLLAAWLLGRLRFNHDFGTRRDIALYVGVAGIGGTALSACVGGLSLLLGGGLPSAGLGQIWLTWWLGDMLGALVVGPALLLWQARRRIADEPMSAPESVLAWSSLLLITLLATTPLSPVASGLPPLVALPLIWLALRGPRYTAPIAALMVSALSAWGVLAGAGPFIAPDGTAELPRLWAFMMTTGFLSLLVGTLGRESRYMGEALRKEQDLNNKVLEEAGNVIVVLDTRCRIVRFNRAAEELTGWRFEDLVGKTMWETLIPPNQQEAVRNVFDNLRLGKTSIAGRHENPWLLRNGRLCPLKWQNTVLRDESDAITHIVAVGYDLTERKAAEHQIAQDRERQAVMRRLLESVLEGGDVETTLKRALDILLTTSWLGLEARGAIFLMEKDGRTLRMVVSRNMAPQTLASCAEVPLGRCHCGQAAASGETQFAAHVDEAHEIGYPAMADHGHCNLPLVSQGRTIGVLALYLPAGSERDARDEAFLASAVDVLVGYLGRAEAEQSLIEHQTNLKQTVRRQTANIVENQRHLETIIDSLPQLFFMKDAAGRYAMVNRRYVEEVGVARERVIGKTDREIHPPAIAAAIIEMDRRVMDRMIPSASGKAGRMPTAASTTT